MEVIGPDRMLDEVAVIHGQKPEPDRAYRKSPSVAERSEREWTLFRGCLGPGQTLSGARPVFPLRIFASRCPNAGGRTEKMGDGPLGLLTPHRPLVHAAPCVGAANTV
jgi:hypothetical protein